MDGDAGGGGDDALNAKEHDRGGHGVDAEEPEDQGGKIRINGSDPCSGTRVLDKRRTETLPANDVLGDAANFRAERKNRAGGTDVSFFPEHESETQNKSADEKQNVQVAIPGGFRRRGGSCGSFEGGGGHIFIMEDSLA